MSQDAGESPFSSPPRDADDLLPEVEPPSAGFIVQLFVVPGLIVAAVMVVTLLFNWIAHSEADPQAYLQHIERGRLNSWQAAHDLAVELGRRLELRADAELAGQVASLLRRKLDEPLPARREEAEQYVGLVAYLVKTASYFPDHLPAMQAVADAAGENGGDEARVVIRSAALEAIATTWADWQAADREPAGDDALWNAAAAAAGEADHALRERAVYALGVLCGWDNRLRDQARDVLSAALDDAHPNVRYNAAAGLARAGEPAAVDVLLEMLDLKETAGVAVERDDASRDAKRVLIVEAALEAAAQLAAAAPAGAEVAEKLLPALNAVAAAPEGDLPEGADDALRAHAKRAVSAVRDPSGWTAAEMDSGE